MREKLRSSKGMTLTELLVALMVVSLIGTAMSLGINSAVKVYRDSTQLYEAETLCGTILTCLEDEFRFGRNVHEDSSGDVVFDSRSFGNNARVTISNEGKVQIGGAELLGAAAYTSDLKVLKDESENGSKISYEDGKVTITIAVGTDSKVCAKQTVTVAPLEG